MPRQETIVTWWEKMDGTRGPKREYRVTYLDDSAERAEAVSFFRKGLFEASNLPGSLDEMSEREAQEYLDSHPMQQQWDTLTIGSPRIMTFVDDDLQRLKHIPELTWLNLQSPELTDRGVSFLRHLNDLRALILYSPLITDRCLKYIARHRGLYFLDLQGSHLVTRRAFDKLAKRLPNLEDIYPPFEDIYSPFK